MAGPFQVGFCVSGAGRLFRAAVNEAAALGIAPALVVAEAKASPDLEEFCRARGVKLVRLPKLPRPEFDAELSRVCIQAKLDLLCLTFDKLLPASLVRHYAGKIINVHPAVLPAFKGMHALQQASESGTLFSGATMHEVDEQMDHGPTIAQCVIGLSPGEAPESIGRRVYPQLEQMYLQVLAWYAAGRVTKDGAGRILVRDAVYGGLPFSPALERPLKPE